MFSFRTTLLPLEYSQAGNPGSAITQLQFSPRDNLIAWTDTDGVFSRWFKPISDNFPDPVKISIGTSSAATVPVKPKTGLELFEDDTLKSKAEKEKSNVDDVELDDATIDVDDGWIVDDMDGVLQAEESEKKGNPFVKEMGDLFSTFLIVGHQSDILRQ